MVSPAKNSFLLQLLDIIIHFLKGNEMAQNLAIWGFLSPLGRIVIAVVVVPMLGHERVAVRV